MTTVRIMYIACYEVRRTCITMHVLYIQCFAMSACHNYCFVITACSYTCFALYAESTTYLACMLPWADARGRCSLFKSAAFLVVTGSARQALRAHELVPATHGWRRAGTACTGSPCVAQRCSCDRLPCMRRRAPMHHGCGKTTRCGAWAPVGSPRGLTHGGILVHSRPS